MYETAWNTDHPGHVVFLLDLSGSMADDEKIDYVIQSLYKTMFSLVSNCIDDDEVKNRMSVSVYGYNYCIHKLIDNEDVPEIGKLITAAKRNGGKIFDKNKEAKPEYQTCMRLAFEKAKQDIDAWIMKYKGNIIPAPIVVNITDGHPYEGENYDQKDVYSKTLAAAKALMNIRTSDGNVRLFNVHYDPKNVGGTVRFPCQPPIDEAMRFMYDASSPMTEGMLKSALTIFPEAKPDSRTMISNEKDVNKLTQFIIWGSSQGVKPVSDAY